MSKKLRIEINKPLNIVERDNGTMNFIFYGEISTNKADDQELAILCLHLLQVRRQLLSHDI